MSTKVTVNNIAFEAQYNPKCGDYFVDSNMSPRIIAQTCDGEWILVNIESGAVYNRPASYSVFVKSINQWIADGKFHQVSNAEISIRIS